MQVAWALKGRPPQSKVKLLTMNWNSQHGHKVFVPFSQTHPGKCGQCLNQQNLCKVWESASLVTSWPWGLSSHNQSSLIWSDPIYFPLHMATHSLPQICFWSNGRKNNRDTKGVLWDRPSKHLIFTWSENLTRQENLPIHHQFYSLTFGSGGSGSVHLVGLSLPRKKSQHIVQASSSW